MRKKSEIDAAVALAEAQTGVKGGKSKIGMIMDEDSTTRSRFWTEEENQFIRENLGRISEAAIAKKLGRTLTATHIHSEREMGLVLPSKDPRILTAEHIAVGLGADGKSIHMLIDRGILPGRRLTMGHVCRVVDRVVFLKWLLNTKNWIYFKPARVGELRSRGKRPMPLGIYDFAFWEDAGRLMKAAMKKWDDLWLTPGQAAKRMGISHHNINRAIREGNLKATRWSNWWILESDFPKKGKFNAVGRLVDKIYAQGHNPRATQAIKTWWKGKKRRWPGGPVKVKK